MDLTRIRNEIAAAKSYFLDLESHPTADGKPYVLAALQTMAGRYYTLSITFPDTYPYAPPSVTVRKPELASNVPHRFNNGTLCLFHQSLWNPGYHHLTFVIERTAKWLAKYEVWRSTGEWPGAQMAH